MKKSTVYRAALVLAIVFVVAGTITGLLVQAQINAHASGLLNPKSEPYTEHWSLPLAENGMLKVELSAVEVKVEPYDGEEVIIDFDGYTMPDRKGIHPRILADHGGQRINIKQRDREIASSSFAFNFGPNFDNNGSIRGQMIIQLPRSSALNLDVSLFSGNVSVADHSFADLVLATSSGNISVNEVSVVEEIDLQTFSGNIEALHVEAREGELETSSGNIIADTLTLNTLTTNQFSGKLNLKNCILEGDASLETSSGNVAVEKMTAENLRVQTFSGDHRLTDVAVADSLSMESSSGKMICDRVSAEQIKHQTFSGNITGSDISTKKLKTDTSSGNVQATILNSADLDCQSFSGKVVLNMPADYEFNLDISTFSGNSDIGYPLTLSKKEKKEKSFSGVVGAGTYTVNVETSSGNISLQPIQTN